MPDPRNPRGVRFRLATLLAVGVCALTSAGHNSRTAVAEWVRRCDQDVLARLGCPPARDRRVPPPSRRPTPGTARPGRRARRPLSGRRGSRRRRRPTGAGVRDART
ncbi:transposase family protein [Streptomyces ziwulingensis]|uniref:transposase family protein n=1 Tax=Streptomyces ziwulingensis TaxID=1045501 RepID=UPI003CD0BA4D